jgi:MFS family permease
MFMPMNAELVLGFEKTKAADTVAAYGVANLFGRILFGLFCDRQFPFSWGKDTARNRLWIYNLALMFCGVVSSFVFKMESYYMFVGYCFVFGLTISSYVCLTSVVLVDLVGLERLTNGLGLLFFVQGIATFVGPPIAGKIHTFIVKANYQRVQVSYTTSPKGTIGHSDFVESAYLSVELCCTQFHSSLPVNSTINEPEKTSASMTKKPTHKLLL